MKNKTEVEKRISKYRAGIFLVLFVDKELKKRVYTSVQLCHIKKIINYIFSGDIREATIGDEIKKLKVLNIIGTSKIEVIPDKLSKERKLSPFEMAIKRKYGSNPETAKRFLDMVNENARKQQNFRSEKYERYVWLRSRLSPGFIANKKNEVARFFGFRYWYGGIVKSDGTKSTYERIRKLYPSVKKSRLECYDLETELRKRNIPKRDVFQTGLCKYRNPNEGHRKGTEGTLIKKPDIL